MEDSGDTNSSSSAPSSPLPEVPASNASVSPTTFALNSSKAGKDKKKENTPSRLHVEHRDDEQDMIQAPLGESEGEDAGKEKKEEVEAGKETKEKRSLESREDTLDIEIDRILKLTDDQKEIKIKEIAESEGKGKKEFTLQVSGDMPITPIEKERRKKRSLGSSSHLPKSANTNSSQSSVAAAPLVSSVSASPSGNFLESSGPVAELARSCSPPSTSPSYSHTSSSSSSSSQVGIHSTPHPSLSPLPHPSHSPLPPLFSPLTHSHSPQATSGNHLHPHSQNSDNFRHSLMEVREHPRIPQHSESMNFTAEAKKKREG